MSNSQKQAVITLIEKKGKDRSHRKLETNLSCQCRHLKQYKNVLPSIIHHNQTGYAKDRYTGEKVKSIFDIIDYTEKENIPGLLIFIGS